MAKKPPSKKEGTILIRVDADLKAKLVKASTKDGRTLSGYVRWVLEKSLRGD